MINGRISQEQWKLENDDEIDKNFFTCTTNLDENDMEVGDGDVRCVSHAYVEKTCAVCGWGADHVLNLRTCRMCKREFHWPLCDDASIAISSNEWFCSQCIAARVSGGYPCDRVQPQHERDDPLSLYVGPPACILRHFAQIHAPRADCDIMGGNLIVAFEHEDTREEFARTESKESLALESTAYMHGYFREPVRYYPDIRTGRNKRNNDDILVSYEQFWPLDRPQLDRLTTDFHWFAFHHDNEKLLRFDLLYLQRYVTMDIKSAVEVKAKFYKGNPCRWELMNHSWTSDFSVRLTQTHHFVACVKLGKPILET